MLEQRLNRKRETFSEFPPSFRNLSASLGSKNSTCRRQHRSEERPYPMRFRGGVIEPLEIAEIALLFIVMTEWIVLNVQDGMVASGFPRFYRVADLRLLASHRVRLKMLFYKLIFDTSKLTDPKANVFSPNQWSWNVFGYISILLFPGWA